MFPNDTLHRNACLKFVAKRIPGLHVGGKTALAWRGVHHNLSPRERLALWGSVRRRLPEFFTTRFPCHYVSKSLLSKELPAGFGLQPLPEKPAGPLVSVLERAQVVLIRQASARHRVCSATPPPFPAPGGHKNMLPLVRMRQPVSFGCRFLQLRSFSSKKGKVGIHKRDKSPSMARS
jgi:hypothetical protein